MSGLYLIGLVVALALAVYFDLGAVPPGGLLVIANILIQLGLYLVVLLALAKPLGEFMARVLDGRAPVPAPAALGWLERLTYKASGVDPSARCAGRSTPSRRCCSTSSACSRSTRCSGSRACCR